MIQKDQILKTFFEIKLRKDKNITLQVVHKRISNSNNISHTKKKRKKEIVVGIIELTGGARAASITESIPLSGDFRSPIYLRVV